MRFTHKLLLVLFVFLSTSVHSSEEMTCRPIETIVPQFSGPQEFSNGILWSIGKNGKVLGFLFGTIHVDDPEILDIPQVVTSALQNSNNFIMEVVPTAEDALDFTRAMFFSDGERLDELLSNQQFESTAAIMTQYGITRDMLLSMKPWAAYIIMSYPADMGEILDLRLLSLAQQYKVDISGLETSDEQLSIFRDLDVEQQIRVLVDAVCHHDLIKDGFEDLKRLYLERDLKGLFLESQKYTFEDDSTYEDISNRLVVDRNIRMFERMKRQFDKGQVFIAVGAMHLPGEEGLLNLLRQDNYEITRVY